MRSIKFFIILGVVFCFCFLYSSKTFAQTTVNFSLVILPAPEIEQVKKEVIPEKVERFEEKEVEKKPIVEKIKQEELLIDSDQPVSSFGILLEQTPKINNIIESISNNVSEIKAQEATDSNNVLIRGFRKYPSQVFLNRLLN